ncbi:MAG: DUF4340 domain-containing protein [Deltaproteobacteria bacterium]|nr:DUF4340 domain-containing protein [Deltaproteobacteria bacterium]
MKTEQKLTVAGVALVALVGGYVVTRKNKEQDDKAHSTQAAKDLPKIGVAKEKAEKVTRLVVKSKDHGEVVLEKKGDAWRVTKPIEAPASASSVDSVLKNLEKLELTTTISATADDKAFERYELDEKQATHVQAFAGDEKLIDAYFGKSGSRGQLARVDGQPSIFGAQGYASYLYAKELKSWRDTDILKFEDANAVSVEIENKTGRFSFTKNADKWAGAVYPRDAKKGTIAEKAAKWERFEEAKVKELLTALKNLKASDFAKEGADTGLETATVEGGLVTIKFKDGNGDLALKVGKKQDGDNRYLVREGGDGTVYVISSYSAGWAVADVEKFSKTDEKKDGKKDDAKGDADLPEMPDLGGE